MSNHSRRKGRSGEREAKEQLPGLELVNLSGRSGADGLWRGRFVEIKRRKSGLRSLYGWLRDVPMVLFREDRNEWLVVMRPRELLDLLEEAERGER
jgi:hypothetical protein